MLRDKTTRNTSRARRQREGWSCSERVVSFLARLLLSGFQGLAVLPERASGFQVEAKAEDLRGFVAQRLTNLECFWNKT